MPGKIPTHDAIWVRLLVEELGSRGIDQAPLLDGTGVTSSDLNRDGAKIRFDKVVRVFETAAQLAGDETLSLRFAQRFDIRRIGLLAYVGMTSPTLVSFWKNVHRNFRVFSEAIDYDVSDLESDGVLAWANRLPESVPRRQFTEFQAAGIIHVMRRLTRREITPLEVNLRPPRNAKAAEFDRFFGCKVAFGGTRNAIRFRDSDLGLPLYTADDELHKVLIDHCKLVLAKEARNAPSIVLDVERAIVNRLPSGEAYQDAVAEALGMSRRTLARRLAEHGTGFREIVDDLRQALAARYLDDSDFSISEIAYLLGYTDVSSFSSAFRRWTGVPPNEMRQGGARVSGPSPSQRLS